MSVHKQWTNDLLLEEQTRLEGLQLTDARVKVISNYLKLSSQGKADVTPEGIALQKLGVKRFTEVLKDYLEKPLRGRASAKRKPLLFYKGKEAELSYLVMNSVVNILMQQAVSLQKLVGVITKNIKTAMLLDSFKEAEPKLYAYLEYEYAKRGQDYIISRKKRLAQLLIEKDIEDVDFKQGLALLEVLVLAQTGLIEKFAKHTRGTRGKRPLFFFKLTDNAKEIIENVQEHIAKASVFYKPLVIPPKNWSDTELGGYHHNNVRGLIKFKTQAQRNIYRNMLEDDELDMRRFYNIVNGAQSTAWRTNKWMFDVVRHIIDNNTTDYSTPKDNPKCIAGIPYQEFINVNDIIKPESYGATYTTEEGRTRHHNREDYRAYYTAKEKALGRLEANNSRRIIYALALDMAKEFSQYDRFYFSYKADFRGRIYPVQQILNPQATGNVKALIEFADGVKPTEEGIYWLKIAVANTSGNDKLSYDERIAWVDSNIDDILKASRFPLETTSFWSDTDEPLMFLNGCKALSDALEGKEVHYPVPLDATCSGIQIYSGLLMDEEGARAVNVINNDTGRPADIYQDVADVVNRRLLSGDHPKEFTFTDSDGEFKEVKTDREAKGLKGKVTRKLTKRNVMTQPYSVTQRGMFNQLRELFDEAEDNNNVFWEGEKWVTIKLLTHLNTQSIFEVVKGAIVGQEYIKNITSVFNVANKPLVWFTPIFRFPVIQASVKKKSVRITSPLGKLKFTTFTNDMDKRRQSSSIAPNFIHSLDATLMFLTVERLMEEGVKDFSLIHDSFAVNCNEVSTLNIAIRDSYIELFISMPLLEWYEQLQDKVKGVELQHPDEVMLYTLNIMDVEDSDYIFS